MASRPRRAAAQKANTAITDMVDSDNHTSSRTGRTMSSRTSRRSDGKSAVAAVSRGPPSEPEHSNHHIHFTVKLPASKLRQATTSDRPGPASRQAARENFEGGEIVQGKRIRNQKKSYVLDSSDEEDDEGEEVDEEAEPEADEEDDDEDDEDAEGEEDDMIEVGDEDAEGEIVVDDTMDLDAEGEDDDGEEDAEGDDDDVEMGQPPPPVIKVSKPTAKGGSAAKGKATVKLTASKALASQARDSDDDEELSELESEADEIQDTVNVGGGDEEDAEGEDVEMEGAEAAEEEDLGSDGSRAETPDLTKMTKRQRARFEENGDSLMKLSDEVQAKKVFTAEELSMRRAEMARRRRNLSDKRNEEVKMETINKLLKKQAPKTKGKSQLAEGSPDAEGHRANPVFVRWISTKDGSQLAIPEEMASGPIGRLYAPGGFKGGKMVKEVS
ncbi:PAPA-1-like conserved region-domain-containing protein [Xylariaceae sp. FL0804]|nr:PAPA-1-like conserved region-domain-containing protein [Xylariaceae sp. FL0804]